MYITSSKVSYYFTVLLHSKVTYCRVTTIEVKITTIQLSELLCVPSSISSAWISLLGTIVAL